jgi:hypothetical protein
MDVSETYPNGRKPEAPPRAFARSLGEVGSDLLSLMELQARLGWEDLKTAGRQAAGGLAAAVVAAGCAIGGLPVLVLGLAEILVEMFGWSRGATLLVLGIVTVGASAILAYYGARRVFQNFAVFRRSKDELIRNLEWLKTLSSRSTK